MKKSIGVARVNGKCENAVATSDIRPLIHVIRGQQVMLDADLAALYGYSTKQFNRQVKNNAEKFDADFMFRLTDDEVANLRCKKCTSSWGGTDTEPCFSAFRFQPSTINSQLSTLSMFYTAN